MFVDHRHARSNQGKLLYAIAINGRRLNNTPRANNSPRHRCVAGVERLTDETSRDRQTDEQTNGWTDTSCSDGKAAKENAPMPATLDGRYTLNLRIVAALAQEVPDA
jgi:hypothetical protein